MVGKQNNFKSISEQVKPTGLNRILSIKTHMRLLLMLIENTLFRKILILITRIL
jgi:hypothetical protein